jgi:cell division protein ZapA
MAQVSVTIAGRPYRMACADGEEAHLQSLARLVDAKIAELRKNFGEIGDQRISIMAAITVADELTEAKRRIGELEQTLEALRGDASTVLSTQSVWSDEIAAALVEAAGRIERIVEGLNPAKSTTA